MEVGDKIICINNSTDIESIKIRSLTLNKVYIIIDILTDKLDGYDRFMILDDEGIDSLRYVHRFVSIKKYRKLKLEKKINEGR